MSSIVSSIVVARDVSCEFANGRELFSGLSFTLDSGLTALVGPNGVGKTVLARLIAGELEPTHGELRRSGPVRLLAQREEPGGMSVDEYLGDAYEWSLLRDRLLGGIDRQASCRTLSGGQWMRVRLARSLADDYLILDEPTNDLDCDGRRLVAEFLRARKGGTLLISHDREALEICPQILELSNRGLTRFGGGWSGYLEAKHRERERLAAALDDAKRERDRVLNDRIEKKARQEKRNRRGAETAARGGAPRILLGALKGRAQETGGRLDTAAMERAQKAVRDVHAAVDELKIDPVMYADVAGCELPAQKLVAQASGFNVRFGDWIYQGDLDFTWRGNVRVAVRGANGSGKSTLLQMLLGRSFDTRGEFRRGDLAACHVDQRCSLLDDDLCVFDNVRAVSSGSDSETRTALARFLFAGDSVFQPVRQLSGGERLRAALARGFLGTQKPELLVLDEPTNNLDLANVEFLESVVSRFSGALVVVSHDERFLEHCDLREELVVRGAEAGHRQTPTPWARG